MSCDLPGQYEKNARRKPLEMRVWAAKGKAFSFWMKTVFRYGEEGSIGKKQVGERERELTRLEIAGSF